MLSILILVFIFWVYGHAVCRHRHLAQDPRYLEAFQGNELERWSDHYTTIFLAGNGDSISQAAYYTGQEGIDGMSAVPSIRTLINPSRQDPFDVDRGWTATLLYPFYYLLYLTFHAGRPVWNLQPYWTRPDRINLAQQDDLSHAAEQIERTSGDIVLYGVSRGASVAISVLSRLDPSTLKRIKLVVAEAPFDSVESVLNHRCSWWQRPLIRLLLKLTRYRADGITPLALVPTLPKTIPIVVVVSRVDDVVGYRSTMNLHRALKAHVHRVDLIKLERSSHGGYTGEQLEDLLHYYQELLKVYREIL